LLRGLKTREKRRFKMTDPKLLLYSFIAGGCVVVMVQLFGVLVKEVVLEFRGRSVEQNENLKS